MTTNQPSTKLIALVALAVVRKKLEDFRMHDLFGKLRFDSFDSDLLAACMNTLAAAKDLHEEAPDGIEIKLPAELVEVSKIQDANILFDGNAAAARNSTSEQRLVIFANGSTDIIEDTLREVTAINEDFLLDDPLPWVQAVGVMFPDLGRASAILSQLVAMLSGLRSILRRNLRTTASFLLSVAENMAAGEPVQIAVNDSLNLLGYPHYIDALPLNNLEEESVWVKAFTKVKSIPSDFFSDGIRPYALSLSTLREHLDGIRDGTQAAALAIYESIVNADGKHSWAELLTLDWERDRLHQFLMEQKSREPRQSLGKQTLDFFESVHNEALDNRITGLSQTFRTFLEEFIDNAKLRNTEEMLNHARLFYADAAVYFQDEPALDKRWDKYLFKEEIEGEDFLDCILRAALSLRGRIDVASMKEPVLCLRCQSKTDDIFLHLNADLLGYFSCMYRGLEIQCGNFIKFRFQWLNLKKTDGHNPLFHFEAARSFLNKRFKNKPSKSVARKSLQIQFHVFIIEKSELDGDLRQKKFIRVTWHLNKGQIALSLSRDLRALKAKSAPNFGNAFKVVLGRNFKQTNSKGLISEISLTDASSFGLTAGTFIAKNSSNLTDLKKEFEALLKEGGLGIDVDALETVWERFLVDYREALNDFMVFGLGAPSIPAAYRSYGALLHEVSLNAAKSQNFRNLALSLLLSIGVFSFVDQQTAYAVVVPWHPIRLFELHCEFVRKAGLVKVLLNQPSDGYPTTPDFLNELTAARRLLSPDFVVVPENRDAANGEKTCREFLEPVENIAGYTLYSRTAGPESRDSGSSLTAVSELSDVVAGHYLKLMPLATNCLSIALPDAVSKRFPLAVLNSLVSKLPEEERLTLVVGGLNAEGYSQRVEESLFQGLTLETSSADFIEEASQISSSLKARLQLAVFRSDRDFMSGLNAQADDACPFDVAFIDRFFTYNATKSWTALPKRLCDSNPYNFNSTLQNSSKRLVRLEDEFISKTLLCGSADECGHEYINAASWLLRNKSAMQPDGRFDYPCLEVNCDDPKIRLPIQTLHKTAQWVVTSNDLIDRRQLINNKIKIVRYKINARTGKTSIVSSEMQTDILSERIGRRLREICRSFSDAQIAELARKILDSSYRISGYVAMRAARLDKNANEIIGLVLSNWLAHEEANELCQNRGEEVLASTSFLLDDYASFFTQDKNIADLLCLTLARAGDKLCVHICITEAKFCAASILSSVKSKSAAQAGTTLNSLSSALRDSEKAQPDRPIWLSRLADMVMSIAKSDISVASLSSDDIIELSDRIKSGDFSLSLDAESHVFIYDEPGRAEFSSEPAIAGDVTQFVFKADDVARLLELYLQSQPPRQAIDAMLGEEPCVQAFHDVDLVRPWRWANGLSLDWFEENNADDDESHKALLDDGIDVEKAENEEGQEDVIQSVVSTAGVASSLDSEVLNPVQEMKAQPSSDKGEQTMPATVSENATLACATPDDETIFAPSFARLVAENGGAFSYSEKRQAWADRATEDLRMILLSRGIPGKVLRHSLTPNGCLVCFEGNEKLTTKEIFNLREMLLSTKGINVVFAKPGPRQFLVFFNDASGERESISMWNAWSRRKPLPRSGGVNLSFVIGLKETDGELLYLNPTVNDPHTLIAGGTGSGKTVLMQTMLLDMAATNPSSKLKFFIIDPKRGIDYGPLQRLPHMAAPLVYEREEASALLEKLVAEMERRYELFAEIGAKNLARYNAKVASKDQLPVLFLVHDELPNWMVIPDYAKSITEVVTQLATKSRAAGIYLIFMAQRPDKDVIPMQVRDNLGNRLVLKLPANSAEIALGEKGAENLLGRGHMAAKLSGTVSYAQVPYLDEEKGDLDEAVDVICRADSEWAS